MADRTADKIGIANITVITADKDAPWAIPHGCVWFTMQCRTATDVRIAVVPNKAAGSQQPYGTMKSGTSWNEDNFEIKVKEGQPIYFAAAAPCVIEIFMGIDTGVKEDK